MVVTAADRFVAALIGKMLIFGPTSFHCMLCHMQLVRIIFWECHQPTSANVDRVIPMHQDLDRQRVLIPSRNFRHPLQASTGYPNRTPPLRIILGSFLQSCTVQ